MKYPRTIYCITNISNKKRYVGSTSNYKSRISSHFSKLKKGIHPVSQMQSDYFKYGKESFEVEELGIISNQEEDEKEFYWMKTFNSQDEATGYNYKDWKFREDTPQMYIRKHEHKANLSYRKLRGLIVEKYKTISAFASFINSSVGVVSNKINGKSEFTKSNIELWSNALEIPLNKIETYFFN